MILLFLGIVVLAALAVIFGFCVTSLENWYVKRHSKHQNAPPPDRRYGSSKVNERQVLSLIASINAFTNKIYTYNEHYDCHEYARAFRERIVITVGIFAALAALVSAYFFWGQWNELREEQRPWVSAKIVSLSSPLTIKDGKLLLGVKYLVKNVGKLPAIRVFFSSTLVPLHNSNEIPVLVHKYCNEIITRMEDSGTAAGITLFPDETSDSPFTMDEALVADFVPENDGLTSVLVPVCTPYKYQSEEGEFHYTPGAYLLVQRTGEALRGIDLRDLSKNSNLEIHRMAQGSILPK